MMRFPWVFKKLKAGANASAAAPWKLNIELWCNYEKATVRKHWKISWKQRSKKWVITILLEDKWACIIQRLENQWKLDWTQISWRSQKQKCVLRNEGQAKKSARGMPWHQEPMKVVISCEKLRGAANELRSGDIRMGKPTLGYHTVNQIAVWGEPPELKHLSRARKRHQPRFR